MPESQDSTLDISDNVLCLFVSFEVCSLVFIFGNKWDELKVFEGLQCLSEIWFWDKSICEFL